MFSGIIKVTERVVSDYTMEAAEFLDNGYGEDGIWCFTRHDCQYDEKIEVSPYDSEWYKLRYVTFNRKHTDVIVLVRRFDIQEAYRKGVIEIV